MEFLNQFKQAKAQALGFITCLILIVLFTTILQSPMFYIAKEMGVPFSQKGLLEGGINKNLFLLLSLIPFLGISFGIYIAVTKIHKIPFINLISTTGTFDKGRFGFAFLVWLILSATSFGIDYMLHYDEYVFQLDLYNFIPLCLIALLIIPLQTSSEELLVRSYLMQIMGIATNKRWIPIVLTSTLFGLLHLSNPEMDQFGTLLILPMYIGSGILFAICTVMDNRLELALGMHAANNIFISIFTTNQNSVFQTDALFEAPMDDLLLNYLSWALGSILFLYIAHKKYGWKKWSYLLSNKPD